MPLISVIVPVYQGEAYIRRCLESLLNQDMADMEILVVDDGSTDGTWEILTAMAREDGRIHPIHQENGGVSAARNTALQQCRGKYVRFADADDMAAENSSSALVTQAEKTGSQLVIADYVEITGQTRTRRSLAPQADCLEQDAFLRVFSRLSNSFYYGVLWNKLFLGDIIRKHHIRFPQGMKWGEDFHFMTDYLRYVQRVAYLRQVVYHYDRRMDGTVVTHFFDSVAHPLKNLGTRLSMYRNYHGLYVHTGQYPRYRWTLWLWLFRFTLHN